MIILQNLLHPESVLKRNQNEYATGQASSRSTSRHHRNTSIKQIGETTNRSNKSIKPPSTANSNNQASKPALQQKFTHALVKQIHHQYIDIIKIEKFQSFLRALFQKEKPFEFIMSFLDDMQNTFDCQKATFFVLSKRLHNEYFKEYTDAPQQRSKDKFRTYIHSVTYDDTQEVEDRKLLALARGPMELCQTLIYPSIITIEKESIRDHQKIALVVRQHKDDGDVLGILQLEYYLGNQSQLEDASQKEQNKHHHKPHFSLADEHTLQFIVHFMGLRLDRFVLQRDSKRKAAEKYDAIRLLQVLCKQRNYKSMMRCMKEELSRFFRFSHCSVLFFSKDKQQLFALNSENQESMDDEEDEAIINMVQPFEGQDLEQYYKNQQIRRDKLKQQRNSSMNDYIIKAKHVMWYPITLGLTSKAFNDGDIAFCNIVQKRPQGPSEIIDEAYIKRFKLRQTHHLFQKDIDNAMGAKDFDNYLIGAIRDNKGEPNGLLQLFNFEEPITSVHIERFDAMAGFLGGCLENITENLKTLQIIFGMQISMVDCTKQANLAHQSVGETLSDYREIELPITLMQRGNKALEASLAGLIELNKDFIF